MSLILYLTQIQIEPGAVRLLADECARTGITRPLVVTDAGVRAAGVLQPALDALRDLPVAVFDQTPSNPTEAAVRAEHPTWHPNDIELKALSAQQASRWAVEQTSSQNTPWDVRADAARLTVPTHIIASDPAVYSIFTGRLADEVRQNPVVSMSVVTGAGHSPHRDLPDDTMRHLAAALG